jgi:hypothetical protein
MAVAAHDDARELLKKLSHGEPEAPEPCPSGAAWLRRTHAMPASVQIELHEAPAGMLLNKAALVQTPLAQLSAHTKSSGPRSGKTDSLAVVVNRVGGRDGAPVTQYGSRKQMGAVVGSDWHPSRRTRQRASPKKLPTYMPAGIGFSRASHAVSL